MSKNSTDDISLIIEWIEKANTHFMFYFYITTIPIGMLLSLTSVFVFARKEFKKTTIGLYNITISIVSLILLVILFTINYRESIGKDILTSSSLNCTAFSFLIRFFGQFPSWLQILVSMDRLFCISYPLRYKDTRYKLTKITCLLIILFILLLFLNILNVFTRLEEIVELNATTNHTTTQKSCAGPRNLVLLRDGLTLLLRLILPLILLALFNSAIAYKLVRIRKEFSNFNSFMVKEYKFTISTLVLNLFYMGSLLIHLVIVIVFKSIEYDLDYANGVAQLDKINRFFYMGLSMLVYNYICNFVVNIRTNVYFRKELVNLLKDIQSAYDGDDNSFLKLTKNGLIIPWDAKLNSNGDIVFK